MSANLTSTNGGHRLFFALWPTAEVRAAIDRAVDDIAMFRDAGRRTASGKHHLTLHFLGGWRGRPDDVIARARDAAGRVRTAPFDLVIDHAGGFAGVRVGWVAPAAHPGLDALWSSLKHALDDAGVGYRPHERFSPHITVLRNVRARLDEVTIDPVPWRVEDFVLVHSHDGRYEVIGRWPLAS